MTKLKICGLTRLCDIEAVNKSGPDFAGFVFADSRRKVSIKEATVLKSHLNSNILAVGVFVNESMDQISKIANAGIIDIVQLHGDESEEYIYKLKTKIKLPVIRAIRVAELVDLEMAEATCADFVLLDTYHKGVYGGTGKCFDWSNLHYLQRPYFLAGGIDLENIVAAKKTGAYCLDISSGAETLGYKDSEKIEVMCQMTHDK